ncbi:MAG: hypothetical protein FWC03_12670, partial [Treponema sp.]|nr:hypothetical protein [Treponema sp.]
MKSTIRLLGFITLAAIICFTFAACPEGGGVKEKGAAVSAPTAAGAAITETSITITAVTAPDNGQTVEYAVSASNTAPSKGWQESPSFTGLTAGTTYYIFARSKANGTYNAGKASAGLQVVTAGSSSVIITAALEDAIADAQTLADLYRVESAGTLPANVPYGEHYVYQTDIDALNAAIAAAIAALDSAATQTDVNDAITALEAAIAVFEQAKQTGTKAVTNTEIETLISEANNVKAGIAVNTDAANVPQGTYWVT